MKSRLTFIALGFGLAFLFAFTNSTRPARHPTAVTDSSGSPISLANTGIYVHDPYGGLGAGTPNITYRSVQGCADGVSSIGVYDDGGSIGAVCISGASSAAVNTAPAAPSTANTATTFNFTYDGGNWPAITYAIDNFFASPIPIGVLGQAFSEVGPSQNWNWRCTRTTANNPQVTTTNAAAATVNTLATSSTWDGTTLLGRIIWVSGTTTTAANQSMGIRDGFFNAHRGSVAGTGGFMFGTRINIHSASVHTRAAFGLFSTTSLLTGTADPSALTNAVYVGANDGDANLSICSNDNSGTATCTTLGASFPAQTADTIYDILLVAPPNATFINYYVRRLDTAAIATGPITTDLPQNTVQLSWQDWLNDGAGGTAVTMYFNYACLVWNY